MPTTTNAQKSQDDLTSPPHRLDLSVAQVVASACAAITATVGASYLGVAGTVIGAAVASVLTVVANAIYLTSLRRTRDRLAGFVPNPIGSPPPRWRPARGRPIPWRTIAVGAVAVFVLLGGLVTIVEAAAGRPLTDIVRNQPGHGTSFLGGESAGSGSSTPTHAPSASVTSSPQAPASTSPTATPSAPSSVPSSSSLAASVSTVPPSSAAQGTGTPTP